MVLVLSPVTWLLGSPEQLRPLPLLKEGPQGQASPAGAVGHDGLFSLLHGP